MGLHPGEVNGSGRLRSIVDWPLDSAFRILVLLRPGKTKDQLTMTRSQMESESTLSPQRPESEAARVHAVTRDDSGMKPVLFLGLLVWLRRRR